MPLCSLFHEIQQISMATSVILSFTNVTNLVTVFSKHYNYGGSFSNLMKKTKSTVILLGQKKFLTVSSKTELFLSGWLMKYWIDKP